MPRATRCFICASAEIRSDIYTLYYLLILRDCCHEVPPRARGAARVPQNGAMPAACCDFAREDAEGVQKRAP